MTVCAMNESRPEVGSSQKRIMGSVSNSQANERRFASPPEIPLMAPGMPVLSRIQPREDEGDFHTCNL